MIVRLLLTLAVFWALFPGQAAAQSDPAGYEPLVEALEQAVLTGEADAYLALLSPAADRQAAAEFANQQLSQDVDRVTATPRFLLPIEDLPEGSGYQVTVELFIESGNEGRLVTWQLDVVREGENDEEREDAVWRIRDQLDIDSVEGLHHLSLTPTKQYDADNLAVLGEDLSLTLNGTVFVAETSEGVTGLVLLGDGVMNFAPQPEAEQGQVRIFSGDETLEAEFELAFVRMNPRTFRSRVSTGALIERAVDPGTLREARAVFDEFVPLSFTLDLSEVSDRLWSLNPNVGDFLAEVRTKRHGTLTYAQWAQQPEDTSLFERETGRIISLYPSAQRRATQGRYFAEDDAVSLDVLDYDVNASFEPLGVTQHDLRTAPELVGCRITGVTRLVVQVKAVPISGFMLRLADELAVSSVTSVEYGPLLFFRTTGQDNIVVNLPTEVPRGTEFTVTVTYEGDLRAEDLEENWIANQYASSYEQGIFGVGEPRYLYSNRSYWYPQALVNDYATGSLTLSVPAGWGVIASGNPDETNPPVARSTGTAPRQFSFVALQPTRYLSTLISRFEDREAPVRQVQVSEPVARPSLPETESAVYYDTLSIDAYGSPRSAEQIDTMADRTADIASFYASLLGDIPYPSMTVAVTDSQLPGGHSPAYFAMINHELPRQPGSLISWKTDPVSFSGFPSFFLAHEVAHQWWGQAVGWGNYHEQWLSEGLSQYFAALYSEHDGGSEVFQEIVQQMRSWAMRHSDEGPIYLGYRLGHIDGEPRVFRALVYNKAAMVLHMLRGLIGDDAFFGGLRRFYYQWRFKKAGTDALQRAFEIEAGTSLTRFFDRWIHEAGLPELEFSSRIEPVAGGEEVVLRFEQLTEQLFDLPVTVDLRYRSGAEERVVVPVTDRVSEVRVPVTERVRQVRVNRDDGALAEIRR